MLDVLDTKPSLVMGTHLPEKTFGPITRTTLALFAGASNDHVRLHIDSDYAKAAGMDDVFAHGMLTMAYLAQALEAWFSYKQLQGWKVRFRAMVPLHAMIHCRGEVVDIQEVGTTARRATIQIGAWTDHNLHAVEGQAIVELNGLER